jgi:lambda family phage minor tail protein L
MTNLIATDVQGQEIGSLIDLFELELPDGSILYFHPGLESDLTTVQFRENVAPGYAIKTYTAFPMMIDGLDISAEGAINRPSFTVANVGTTFKGVLGSYKNKDLIGQRVTRRQTLKKYLVGESPDLSSPPKELNKVTYVIDRISSENNITITFEVSAIYDLEGITLPRRLMVGKFCSWMYQGYHVYGKGGCTWATDSIRETEGNAGALTAHNVFFNIEDNPLVSQTWLSANATTYNASANYEQDDYVVQASSGKYFLAQYNHSGQDVTTSYWKEVFPYTDHAASTAYSVGDLVKANVTLNNETLTTIFYCTKTHNSASGGTAIVPSLVSEYWRREELCGKTLNSCKCRFQASVVDPLTAGSPPSSIKISSKALPFGSFIGTDKY